MKKALIIYFAGCVLGWFLGFNHVSHSNDNYKIKTTYRDALFCGIMSLGSWVDVAALLYIQIEESDILNTTIN